MWVFVDAGGTLEELGALEPHRDILQCFVDGNSTFAGQTYMIYAWADDTGLYARFYRLTQENARNIDLNTGKVMEP